MPRMFVGLMLALSAIALSGCSALKTLAQKNQLTPEAAADLAALPFDAAAPVTVRGRVTTLLFPEPEAMGAIVVEAEGGADRYVFSTAATPDLARQGFNRFTLAPGEEVIVTGVLAKGGLSIQGYKAAQAITISKPAGAKLFVRTA